MLYAKGDRSGLPSACVARIEAVLSVLDVTSSIAPLRLPGLHPLQGDRKGEWSVKISGNRRLVFRIVDRV